MPVQSMTSPGLANPYSPAYPGSPGYVAHAAAASPPVTSPGYASPATALPPPPPPAGGFSQYSYSSAAGQPAAAPDYGIHQQVYRPTEGEVNSHYKPKQEVRGRLEENAGRLERGVTGVLKRFEKKFG
jgi:hypothetical protein